MHDVIVPEEDHRTFAISHPDHLKLYASPLATQEDMHNVGHIHDNSHGEPHLNESHHNHSVSSSSTEHAAPEMMDPDVPILKRAHEASTIQLFFDLFFVANLTTFTSLHEIDTWTGKFPLFYSSPTRLCRTCANRQKISHHTSATLL